MNSRDHDSCPQMLPQPIDVTLVKAQRQQVWGKLAVINFAFGSAGAGLYLLSVWFQMLAPKVSVLPSLGPIRLAACGSVCLGLFAVAGEAGRPGRSRFLLSNVRHSWMSRESLAAILFVPMAVLTSFVYSALMVGLAAGAASLFIISQGFILYRARAIPAWNLPTLPAAFVSSAFAAGSGLLLIVSQTTGTATANTAVLVTVLACSAADLSLWSMYLFPPQIDELARSATQSLRKKNSVFWTIILGRVIPTLIVLLALLGPDQRPFPRWSLTIAGLALFVGSWAQKTQIIRAAGYLVPIRLQLQISAENRRTKTANLSPPTAGRHHLNTPDLSGFDLSRNG